MLKGRKPNKHILKPLNMPINKELVDAPINIDLVECEKQNSHESNDFSENYELRNDASHRYNNNKRLHDSYVKDISESQQNSPDISPIKEMPIKDYESQNGKRTIIKKKRTSSQMVNNADITEDHIDLGLNDLTQEDKFFLIQQIEDLNKNIRYC